MKLKLIVTAIVLINSSSIVGMDTIKMPRADVLQKRLHRFGVDALAPHRLVDVSAEQAPDVMLTPQRLAVAIGCLISGCSDQKGNLPGLLARVPSDKIHSLLMEAFVGDDVCAMEQLKKRDLYTPSNMTIVKMPKADVLRLRLEKTHLDLFIKNSGLVENLADCDWTSLGVALELDDSIKRFSEFMNTSGRPKHLISSLENAVRGYKQALLGIILQDTPAALEELRALRLAQ